MIGRGAALALATGVLLSACTGTPSSPTTPTAAPTSTGSTVAVRPPTAKGTVRTSAKTPLSLREQPSTSSRRLARIPHKTVITMACKTLGDNISDGKRASNVWNRVTYKKRTGYVASVFVNGGDSAVLTICQSASSKPTSTTGPTRPPNVEPKIVEVARGQRGKAERKKNCNPYGGCMAWSSLFATWVWNKAGNSIPRLPFSGDLYSWGVKHNRAHQGVDGVGPGDLVLYGTGPENPRTSTHVDVVVAVLPDGRLRVVGGDVKNKVAERSVTTKGIYAWVDA